MRNHKILVPYNFTKKDDQALDFVIDTFANQKEIEVTLFNTYVSVPEIDIKNNPIMDKMAGNLTFLRAEISRLEEALKNAKQKLVLNGFPTSCVHCIFQPKVKDIAHDIINTVEEGKFDIVVLNRKPGKISRFFTGSVFDKVVTLLKDVTVCIVT
jgi:hypothetical protein